MRNLNLAYLVDIFSRATEDRVRAGALLEICNKMVETNTGFSRLRRDFPTSPFQASRIQLNEAAANFKDAQNLFLAPSADRQSIVTTQDYYDSFQKWGRLFLDVDRSALDGKIITLTEAVLPIPRDTDPAFRKFLTALRP